MASERVGADTPTPLRGEPLLHARPCVRGGGQPHLNRVTLYWPLPSPLMPQISDSLRAAAARLRTGTGEAADVVLDTAFWYGIAFQGARVVLILALAFAVLAVVGRVRRRWVRGVEGLPTLDPRRQRTLTVAGLLGSAAQYVVWPVAAIMALAELGLDVGPLLAGAGVAGLAVGFGAQTLVKDVISGVFLLFDNTLHVGDLVRIGADEGTVEYIGLRLIKLRKFDGELLMVPAGELRAFGNKSIGYARALVSVGLPYERDVDRSLAALQSVADEWAAEAAGRRVMLGDRPEVQAVTEPGASALTARIVVQVQPGEQWAAERELRRLVRKRFDEGGVEPDAAPPPARDAGDAAAGA